MLPLKDDVPGRTTPVVTVSLIAVNVLAFLYWMSLQYGAGGAVTGAAAAQDFIIEFGATPCRITGTCAASVALPAAVTIVTSMFLHGGLFHIFGNMLYLWIFGNNVEDTLGHGRFVIFYVLSGVAAAMTQTMVDPASTVPMVGASGAVSGVLGAYLVLFPYAKILTWISIGFYWRFVHVPAVVVLGFWIVVQLVNGVIAVSLARGATAAEGGVAWFAHIGGFLAGIALLFLLRPRRAARL